MNDSSATSAPGASLLPEGVAALTAAHFVLIALVALLALAIIVAGVRRSRARKAALRQVERNAVAAGVPSPAAEPTPVLPPEPAPIAPPAPPLPGAPIPAAAPFTAAPAVEAADAPSQADHRADDPAGGSVTQLKGLGPKVATRLAELGVTTVGQLAALSDDDAAALDAQLGPFSGRMARDRWIEQARFLAAGDRAGFEAVFGRL